MDIGFDLGLGRPMPRRTIRPFFNGLLPADGTFTGGPNATVDNDGELRSPNVDVPSIAGGRWATTVETGAVLSGDLVSSGSDPGKITANGSNVAFPFVGVTGVKPQTEIFVTYEVVENTLVGSGALRIGGFTGATIISPTSNIDSTVGIHTVKFTTRDSGTLTAADFWITSGYTGGTITLENVSLVQAIPQWVETDIDGSDLYANTLVRGQKLFTDADTLEFKRLLIEPARTNKCTCRKATPTDTSNITLSGDPSASLTVIDDTAYLAAAGLDKICTSGNVYKLDNSAGTTVAYCISGLTGNVNAHTSSVFVRGGTGYLSISGAYGTRTDIAASENYHRVVNAGQIPGSASSDFRVMAYAGSIVYFILPQLEEGAFVTSPIFRDSNGDDPLTVITRQASRCVIPSAGRLRANNIGLWGQVIPSAGGDLGYFFAAYTDAANRLGGFADATTVRLVKEVADDNQQASSASAHAAGTPFQWQAYLSRIYGMGIRVREWTGATWGAWSAWATNPDTQDAPIADTFEIGSHNGTSQFAGNYQMLRTFWHSDPKTYLERIAA